MVEFRELRFLLAVAEHLHFAKAAESLGVSQPAVTKGIQRLEADLGARLFDRSRAGVVITAIGQLVVERARALLGDVEELCREVELARGGELGEITVGIGPAMSESFVTTAIAAFAESHVDAHVAIRVDNWRQLSEWLHDGTVDLYVADVQETAGDERVHVVRLPREAFVWFVRSGHPLVAKKRVRRQHLLEYPIVTPRMPEWARRWFAEAVAPDEPFDPDREYGTVECENYAMLKRMVVTSDCVSVCLRSTIADEVAVGTIATLPIRAPRLQTSAGIVHLRSRTLSPLAEAFIQEVLTAAERARGR